MLFGNYVTNGDYYATEKNTKNRSIGTLAYLVF